MDPFALLCSTLFSAAHSSSLFGNGAWTLPEPSNAAQDELRTSFRSNGRSEIIPAGRAAAAVQSSRSCPAALAGWIDLVPGLLINGSGMLIVIANGLRLLR